MVSMEEIIERIEQLEEQMQRLQNNYKNNNKLLADLICDRDHYNRFLEACPAISKKLDVMLKLQDQEDDVERYMLWKH